MFWLIENTEQLKTFYYKQHKNVFVEPIYYHDHVHSKLNEISLLYIHPLDERKGYVISLNHSETTSVNKTHVLGLFKTFNTIFLRDQKSFLYHFPLTSLVDISFVAPEFKPFNTQAHEFLYRTYPNKQDINRIVPIVKHYERCEYIYEQVKDYCYEENKFYSKISKVFFAIEKNGIKIDENTFYKHFEPTSDFYSIKNGSIFTNYNVHTTTGRPSNSFNNINFAALNKESGCRKSFIPKNDYFLEFDITAYHPTLAAKLIGYDKSTEHIYQDFATMFDIPISEAKELMFRQLYGGIMDEYKQWDYFKKIQDYVFKTWKIFKDNGYIECPISKHKFHYSKLDNMNPQKLFNYILQNQETSNNANMLWDIIKILKGANTKLVLYTYDAFLFDVDKNEEEILENINQIFRKNNVFIKTKHNTTYDF